MFPDVAARMGAVVDRLRALDIGADIDPAKVSVPGVWVKWMGTAGPYKLDGDCYVGVELVCMVPANDLGDSIPALADLASEVVEELGFPDSATRTQGTVLPNSPVALPSVVLPYLIA